MKPSQSTIKEVIDDCSNCKGKQQVVVTTHATNNRARLITCPICQGSGKNKQIGAKP